MPMKPEDRKTAPRKSHGFRRAGVTARRAVEQIAGKQGFAEADVLLNWAEIAGEALAAVCEPVRVIYGKDRALGATLLVRTNSARAPEVEMKAPLLIERVNQHYGYRAIRRLKITQSTGRAGRQGFAEDQSEFSGPTGRPARPTVIQPTVEDEAAGAEMASGIQSAGLRAALGRMGAHVLARSRVKHDDTPKEG